MLTPTCCRSARRFLATILGIVASLPVSAQPLARRFGSHHQNYGASGDPAPPGRDRAICRSQAARGAEPRTLRSTGNRRPRQRLWTRTDTDERLQLLISSFSDSCGGHASSLRAAVNILIKLSAYDDAATTASRLIELEPFNDNGYYLARAYETIAAPYPKRQSTTMSRQSSFLAIRVRIASVELLWLGTELRKAGAILRRRSVD